MDWIHLTQNTVWWPDIIVAVMNLCIFCITELTVSESQPDSEFAREVMSKPCTTRLSLFIGLEGKVISYSESENAKSIWT